MKSREALHRRQGFALVLTLALLALLVLAIYALSALTRVGSQVATTGTYQVQARQNALLGMNLALGQLQQFAGPDKSVTGTADIVPGTKQVNSRWTGVWLETDNTPRWLVSGIQNPDSYDPGFDFGVENADGRKILPKSVADIVLVGSGSTNTSTTTDRYFPGDAVLVPRVPIPSYDAAGTQVTTGDYAFWVGDEGVKLSAALPGENPPGAPAAATHALGELPGGWTPNPANALKALSYEQLINAGAGTVSIKSTFHGATLGHVGYLDYPAKRAGLINVNSAGTRLWQGVMGTFDPTKTAAVKKAFAADIARVWSSSGVDKIPNGAFRTVAGFFDFSPVVDDAITGPPGSPRANLVAFKNAIRPWLTTRSDTFRIRAYGDALNPWPEVGQAVGKVEATAYCEVIVQRVKDSATTDGRFVITYFRWLGPDDI